MGSNGQSGTNLRILIVDDDPILGHLFLDVLESYGHRCHVVKSGAAALAALAQESFDLVISDLRMPEMTGQQLWERLKVAHPTLAACMIFVSAEEPGAENSSFLRKSGHAYLKKPFSIRELLRIVEEAASRRPRA